MSTLEIQKIRGHGFKNHEDLVEFELGKHTKVSGRNGAGKTTIGEAITWGLLGTDLTGNERATTRLLNDKCKDVYVELDFLFKEQQHTLVRRRRGTTTSMFLDDKAVKQTDLITFYHSKELFLSIFSPTYFPSLAPKGAKEVLESVLDGVKKEDVYKKLPQNIVETLRGTGFGNPNLYLANQRERLKEIDQDLQYWNGFKEGKQEEVEIPELVEFDEKPLQELKKQLDEVNKLKVTPLHNIDNLLIKREDFRSKANEIKSQIEKLELSRPNLTDISKLSLELNSLRNSYKDKQVFVKSLDNTVSCPKCETVIDLDDAAKQEILKELEGLRIKGSRAANKLKEIEISNAKLEAKHAEQSEEKYKELHQELAKFEIEMDNLNIRKLQQENRTSTQEQEDVIAAQRHNVTEEIKVLENAKQQALLSNSQRDDLIKRKEDMGSKIEDAVKSIAELDQEEHQVKIQIDFAKQFASKRLEIQAKQIDKHLEMVTIQLEKIIESSGEVKPDFKILYDNKEFAILSNSERIKAGLEVANLLMNLSGLHAPIFVDNAESITEIPKVETQLIEARVKEGSELIVEVV